MESFAGIWKRAAPSHEAAARMATAEPMMRKLTIARGRAQLRRDFRFRSIPSSFSKSDVVLSALLYALCWLEVFTSESAS